MDNNIQELTQALADLKTELNTLTNFVEINCSALCESVSSQIKELENTIQGLKKTTISLQTVPKKLSSEINTLAPQIGEYLNNTNEETLKSFVRFLRDETEKANSVFKELASKLSEENHKSNKPKSGNLKRYFLGITISICISVLASLAGTYSLIRYFPTRVTIDNPENITLQNSEVSLWSSKNVQILENNKVLKKK